jgi:lipopolysaccharide/colanic/teichoic acid biosynthesis glycosyltransferase
VWRGEMSLVGPRPLLMRYTEYFTEEERLRFIVRPGITGAAQVDGRNTASWNKRLALDVQYVGRLSIVNDVKILAQTIARVFRRSGVVVDPESTMLNLDDERRIANPG